MNEIIFDWERPGIYDNLLSAMLLFILIATSVYFYFSIKRNKRNVDNSNSHKINYFFFAISALFLVGYSVYAVISNYVMYKNVRACIKNLCYVELVGEVNTRIIGSNNQVKLVISEEEFTVNYTLNFITLKRGVEKINEGEFVRIRYLPDPREIIYLERINQEKNEE